MHFVEQELRAARDRVNKLDESPETNTPDMSSLEFEYERGRVSKAEFEEAEAKVKRVFLMKLEVAGIVSKWFRERDRTLMEYLEMQQTRLAKVAQNRPYFDAQPREGNVSPGFRAALATDMHKAINDYLEARVPMHLWDGGLWITAWLPELLDFFNDERMRALDSLPST